MKKLLSKQGFTLIELLIVIVIIGILAAAFLPNILGAPARARDAGRQGDLNKIIAAVEVFNADHGHYPVPSNAAGVCINDGLDNAGVPTGDADLFAGYFPSGVPVDPDTTSQFTGTGCLTGGYYYCLGDGTSGGNYMLAAKTETDSDNATLGNLPMLDCTGGTPVFANVIDDGVGAYVILN